MCECFGIVIILSVLFFTLTWFLLALVTIGSLIAKSLLIVTFIALHCMDGGTGMSNSCCSIFDLMCLILLKRSSTAGVVREFDDTTVDICELNNLLTRKCNNGQ